MRLTHLLLVISMVPLAQVPRSGACTCSSYPTIPEALESADLVFAGTAAGTEYEYHRLSDTQVYVTQVYYTFRVDRIWKGLDQVDENGEVVLTNELSTCDRDYNLGAEAMVYANCNPEGKCVTGACHRGRLKDRDELGPPAADYRPQPAPEGLQVLNWWVIDQGAAGGPKRTLAFSDNGDFASFNYLDGDFEPRDEGMFTLSGLTLTVLIRSSTDPDRKGVIFTTDVSFPAPGRATFTNAALLTAGSTEEETVSAGSWSTAVETGTWGRIKASIR